MSTNITLANGVEMPSLGLGTWLIDAHDLDRVVKLALDTGYTLFDTAQAYETQLELGQALSHTPRQDIFITSKVWNSHHGYYQTLEAFEQTLEQLGTDYLDSYMIHWPCPKLNKWQETWSALETLYSRGYTKTIGVSNFNPDQLEHLLEHAQQRPHILQTELHPLWQQTLLRELCTRYGIHVQASRPLAHGRLLDSLEYCQLAHELDTTPTDLAVQWTLAQGCSLVPRSTSSTHLALNWRAQYTQLDPSTVERVNALYKQCQLQTGDDSRDMHRGCP